MKKRRLLRRLFAAAGLVGFPLLIGLSFEPPGTRTEGVRDDVALTLLREAKGLRDRFRFQDFDYSESEGNREVYRLRASEAIAFFDSGEQIYRLKDVRFESRDTGAGDGAANGRTFTLHAPRAEFQPATKAFRVFDGVRIEGEGLSLSGQAFRYESARKIFFSEGEPVTGSRGGLVASALRGSLETKSQLLRLEKNVRLRGREEKGRLFDVSAAELEVTRLGRLSARGSVTLKSDGLVLRCESVDRTPSDGGGERLVASGNARALVAPPGRNGGSPPLMARGEQLEVERDDAGQPLRLVLTTSSGPSRVDISPTPRGGARRVLTARVEAGFRAGHLSEVVLPVQLDAAEAVPAGGTARAGLRELSANRGRLTFAPDGETLEVALLDGDARVRDGTGATVRAPRATYRGVDSTALFAGDAGTPAEYRDEKARIAANTLSYRSTNEEVEAVGNVRASFRGGSGRSGVLGSRGGAPTFSESDFLRASPREKKMLLKGNVRAWQDENVLRSQTLILDDREKSMRAEGNVQAVLRRRKADGQGKGAVETVTASGKILTHREQDRLIRVEGDSVVVSGTYSMKADVTDFRLGADDDLESAEAKGSVVVEDRSEGRRGEGNRASWKPKTDSVVLEGRPATALDGKGSRLTGAILTFQKGRSRIDVQTIPGVGSEAILRPEGP